MRTVFMIAALALALTGCEDKKAAPAAEKPTAEAKPAAAEKPADKAAAATEKPADATATATATGPAAEARKLFDTLCVTCHGTSGKGDGAAAANLNPKPRDYTDKAWQAKVTDEKLAQAIVGGGPAVGLSPLMPPNPGLKEKPEVVAELVKIIRAFGK